ncbi:MAG: tetratricopeptide repeat protein [bacterium]|nr:tetratricopeptide repeat protein [bacterium]
MKKSSFFLFIYIILHLIYVNNSGAFAPDRSEENNSRSDSSALEGQKAAFYVNLGFSYYRVGKYQETVEQFENALSLDKNYRNIHALLGSAFLEMGNTDKAIAAYKKQIELTPQVAGYHYNLGLAYLKKQSYDEAIQAFKTAIAIDNNAVKAHRNLGYVLLKIQKLSEAVHVLKQALALDATSWNDWYNIGVANYLQEDYANAVLSYQRALELQPQNSNIQTALAKAYLKQGHTDAALDQYQAARESRPFDPEIRYEIGLVYRQRKQYPEAIAEFQWVLKQDPSHVDARTWLAVCLIESGQILNPDDVGARLGLESALIKKSEYETVQIQIRSPAPKPLEGQVYIEYATAQIQTQPLGAKVYVNGMLTGESPLSTDLPLGKHVIRLALPDHYDLEAQVELTETNQTISFYFPLLPLD